MKVDKEKFMKGAASPKKQKGMTLVVVMVILLAMTFLGLSAMTDSNLQLSMVRNAQFENMAYSGAMSEFNAQIDLINGNNGMNDPAIIAVVSGVPWDADGDGIVLETQIDTDDAALATLLPGIVDDADERFTQTLTLRQPNPDAANPAPNFSINPDSGFRWRFMEFNSQVIITDASGNETASGSNQTQGIQYLGAN